MLRFHFSTVFNCTTRCRHNYSFDKCYTIRFTCARCWILFNHSLRRFVPSTVNDPRNLDSFLQIIILMVFHIVLENLGSKEFNNITASYFFFQFSCAKNLVHYIKCKMLLERIHSVVLRRGKPLGSCLGPSNKMEQFSCSLSITFISSLVEKGSLTIFSPRCTYKPIVNRIVARWLLTR